MSDRCTCRWSNINSASIEPPYKITDMWCPVHGKDPDEEYEKDLDYYWEYDDAYKLFSE